MARRKDYTSLTTMEKSRKILHALSSLLMFIYFVPREFFIFKREWFLLAPLGFFVLLELVRISKGWLFFGMRDYERRQVSGYIWAGSTLVLAVMLFPPKLVIPIYVCWAWLDPICSILKRNPPWYPVIPFALYV
ncbi:MAG TPA: hypothetical protein ENN76_03110, partial [Euryarchaeota archaeon]|nr:hypothetical protein [Euryarchaeota archaeon]